jgi:hypothetical protein
MVMGGGAGMKIQQVKEVIMDLFVSTIDVMTVASGS